MHASDAAWGEGSSPPPARNNPGERQRAGVRPRATAGVQPCARPAARPGRPPRSPARWAPAPRRPRCRPGPGWSAAGPAAPRAATPQTAWPARRRVGAVVRAGGRAGVVGDGQAAARWCRAGAESEGWRGVRASRASSTRLARHGSLLPARRTSSGVASCCTVSYDSWPRDSRRLSSVLRQGRARGGWAAGPRGGRATGPGSTVHRRRALQRHVLPHRAPPGSGRVSRALRRAAPPGRAPVLLPAQLVEQRVGDLNLHRARHWGQRGAWREGGREGGRCRAG